MPKTIQKIKSQSNESPNDASSKGAVKCRQVQREFEDGMVRGKYKSKMDIPLRVLEIGSE